MRAKNLVLVTGLLVVVMLLSTPGGANAQSTTEVDLKVDSGDISFSPPSPVVVGTSVQIKANIHNLGIAYVVAAETNDQVDYDFSLGSLVTGIKIGARVRSTNGDLVTMNVWVDAFGANPMTTSSTTWEDVQTTFPALVLGSGDHTLHVQLFSGGDGNTDLHLDTVEIRRFDNNNLLFSAQAEDYDGGGGSVDAVRPQNVTVTFYDGDPGAGGTQIGAFSHTATDGSRTTESGSEPILSAGGSDTVSQNWTATPVGTHDIYVEITADANEVITGNNKAFATIEVTDPIPTLSEWAMILLALLVLGAGVVMLRRRAPWAKPA